MKLLTPCRDLVSLNVSLSDEWDGQLVLMSVRLSCLHYYPVLSSTKLYRLNRPAEQRSASTHLFSDVGGRKLKLGEMRR